MKRGVYRCFWAVALVLIWIGWGFGATKVYLPHDPQMHVSLKQVQTFSKSSLKDMLGLVAQEDLQLLRQRTDKSGVTHLRYNQRFNNIPVWGHHIIAAKDKNGVLLSLHGTKVAGILADVGGQVNIASALQPQDMLGEMKLQHIEDSGLDAAQWFFENEVNRFMIYVDQTGQARVCILVSFFADVLSGGQPTRPVMLLDAFSGEIVFQYEGLTHADGTGPGGNLKIGKYQYGTDYPAFEVTESGTTCIMNTSEVKTVNLNHGSSGSDPFEFTCYENTIKEINGAYSPLNDAHAFGLVVYDMYNDWFGVPPLTFQLMLRVHYLNNYENAFWNGSSMTFGDGASTFHPLVSLDVVSHEVSHGFTEQNSDLIYSGQSGGINEAFSDIAGEGAEFYFRNSNDFWVGYDIYKAAGKALRYMDDPPKDGKSIDSANDYSDGMDVHYSSGVFNKAFFLLATTQGWNTQKAFEVFVKANQDYWEPSTNFVQGAEGVRDAAIALSYSAEDIKDAFDAVDVNITIPEPFYADFTYEKTLLEVQFTDKSNCENCNITSWQWDFGDGATSDEQNPAHTYASDGTYTVTLTVTNDKGESDDKQKDIEVSSVPEYCESKSENYFYLWIAEVGVGNFINSSGGSNYSDFTDKIIQVQPGTATTLTLTPGYNSTKYTVYWRVWADLNGDGDFVDADEMLFEASGTDPASGQLTVPAGTLVGDKRLRVSMAYGDYRDSCETFTYGEVEDYTLRLQSTTGPVADFSTAIDGLQVTFTDESSGDISDWAWDFGDGNISSDQNPVHTYAAAGTYPVKLTVTDTGGQSDSAEESVTVSVAPQAAFSTAIDGLTVTFTDTSSGDISSWEWEFGDGDGSDQQNPVHTYAAVGSYSVKLTVTDTFGQSDSIEKSVTVSGGSLDYCDAGGNSQSYEWIKEVAVGGFVNASDASGYSDFTDKAIAMTKDSAYQIELTPGYSSSSYTERWRIWADLNRDGDFDDAGEQLFEGSGSGAVTGDITLDANTPSGDTRLRVAMRWGHYPEACGSFPYGEVEDYILRVSGGQTQPTAAFSITMDGLTVSFTDESTTPQGSIDSWDWDFGDGASSVEQNPVHAYGQGGDYTVALTVIDSNGQSASVSKEITVVEELEYCASAGNSQGYEWIKEVAVGGFANASEASGYSDFTDKVVTVAKGKAAAISLTPGYASSTYPENWRLWADLNRDGDFDDAGEMLYEGNGSGTLDGQLTVPADTSAGNTRLRVSMRYRDHAAACGDYTYGEVEDYTLSIQ